MSDKDVEPELLGGSYIQKTRLFQGETNKLLEQEISRKNYYVLYSNLKRK